MLAAGCYSRRGDALWRVLGVQWIGLTNLLVPSLHGCTGAGRARVRTVKRGDRMCTQGGMYCKSRRVREVKPPETVDFWASSC